MGCCASSESTLLIQRRRRAALYSAIPVSVPHIPQIRVGRLADFYLKDREIGFGKCYPGSYGTVIQAVSRTNKQVFAVKSVQCEQYSHHELRSALEEVVILRGLSHPNIVRLREVILAPASVHIVTELCSGGSLYERYATRRRISEQELADLMRQLLSAVAYCHKRRIVHRDIKLENVLLETFEAGCSLKLIDFGSAVQIPKGKTLSQMAGTVTVTQPFFIAPEVLQRRYTEKCDVWSCGVVLFFLVTGSPPFPGTVREEIFARIRQDRVNFTCSSYAAREWGTLSEEGRDFAFQMLTKDASSRPSAADLLSHRWLYKWEERGFNHDFGSFFGCIGSGQETLEVSKGTERSLQSRKTVSDLGSIGEATETEDWDAVSAAGEKAEWRQRLSIDRVEGLMQFFRENEGEIEEAQRRFETGSFAKCEWK